MCENNAVYSIGLSLVLLGCLLLAIFTSEYVPDYNYSKDFSKVTCSIESSVNNGNVCCQASVSNITNCQEEYIYPCLLVTASISDNGQTAIFYDGFVSATYGGRIKKCSYFHCDSSSYSDRLEDVTKFNNSHQPDSSHTCYFGIDDNINVTLESVVSRDTVIATCVVSILILLAGVIVCVVMCIIDKHRDKSKDVENIPPSAENLKHNNESDDDSEIETLEMNTTTTSVSARSSGTNKSNLVGNSPAKRQQSFVASGHK